MKDNIRSIINKSMLMALIFVVLTACTDELKYDNGLVGTYEEGLTIYIPNINTAANFGQTRADGEGPSKETSEALTEEAGFTNLYLLSVNENGTVKKYSLNNAGNISTNSGYDSYTVPLDPGKYRFYVVANLDDYINGKVDALTSNEETIKKAVLNFADESKGYLLEAGNLPMACLAKDIKLNSSNATEVGDEYITISRGESTLIYADLTFLCSKVRFTILFDKEAEGTSFTSNAVDFEKDITATNTRREMALTEAGNSLLNADKFLDSEIKVGTLKSVEYPAGGEYLETGEGEDKIPGNLKTTESWEKENQRAWQTIVYLPENNISKSEATILNFTGKGTEMKSSYPGTLYWEKPSTNSGYDAESESTESYGLERGCFYDIVAYLKSPGVLPTDTEIKIYDWTIESLFYQLHGPYELIVQYTQMPEVISGQWKTMGFDTDAENVAFEVPTIKIKKGESVDEIEEIDFLIVKEVSDGEKDENGEIYAFTDEFSRHIRVTVNPDIPLKVIRNLNVGQKQYVAPDGTIYMLKSPDTASADNPIYGLDYFHIIAANINKRINIQDLTVDADLNVTPLRIVINTREYYTDPEDEWSIPITFSSNYDDTGDNIASFTITDHDGLFDGLEEALILDSNGISISKTDDEGNVYKIGENKGIFNLLIKNIKSGIAFWTKEQKFRLTFKFKIDPVDGLKEKNVEREVIIIVNPFKTTYTIHFKDNTKTWDNPHIFVYQDLTLPSNLFGEHHGKQYEDFAGKIVGYVELNPTLGRQWNAATQYVFSNNISFKGWKGYGGPNDNDPYALAYCETDNPNDKHYTMGFVMFGEPEEDNNGQLGSWNFDYSYQKWGDGEKNDGYYKDEYYKHDAIRKAKYNYDVNFNEDHEVFMGSWGCPICPRMNHDYNGGEDNDGYPGISMAYEGNGWWKYILTGVAQPGKTMLFFANSHAPWDEYKAFGNYYIEDFRYPGDYEAGLQLFDYESNEGWFLFDGNGTNKDQHFYDSEPPSRQTEFDANMIEKMRIEIMKPSDGKEIDKIEIWDRLRIAHKEGSGDNYSDSFNNDFAWGKDYEYDYTDADDKAYKIINGNELIDTNGKYYIEPKIGDLIKDEKHIIRSTFTVKIYLKGETTPKRYELAAKNFKWNKEIDRYITIDPLRFEFEPGMTLMVKWSDNIAMGSMEKWHWTYQPRKEGDTRGCNSMNIYWGGWYGFASETFIGKEIGNYKYIYVKTGEFPSETNQNELKKDEIILQLSTTEWGEGYKYRTLRVEDLPKMYNPDNKKAKYQINWHMLRPGYYTDQDITNND